MLLANRASALKVSTHEPKFSVLRHHPPPKSEVMQNLTTLLTCHGIHDFKTASNKQLAASLNRVSKRGDLFFNRLVRIMTTRCMEEAQYFVTGPSKPSAWYHYGLAMTHYTHFTSPIRRYADCIVHRILADSLGKERVPKKMKKKVELEAQVAKLNLRHRMAQWSGRASVQLHHYLYFKAKGAVVAEAVIMRVRAGRPPPDDPSATPSASQLQVAVEEYCVEGYLELDPRDWRVIPERQRALGRPLSPYEGVSLGIFDRIVVKVEADLGDGRSRSIKLSFVSFPRSNTSEGSASDVATAAVSELPEPLEPLGASQSVFAGVQAD